MPKISQTIDKLTNSIINRISGESFATDVIELKKEELKTLKKGWKFDWNREFLIGKVYKLVNRYTRHYTTVLKAKVINGDRMYIDTNAATFLVNKYFKD